MLKFSFLISLYNGEKYLDRLFTSLLSQDIPAEEYEIVCVDDCSKDDTTSIVARYQAINSNVRLIKNEHNSRLSTNINTLVSEARGIYFWILGQDDYIEENCLKGLWYRLEQDSLDVLVFNYRRVHEDETTLSECHVVKPSMKTRGTEWINQQFSNRDYCQYILGYEWRAVFRADHWREKHIRCIDGMNYEDTIIMLKAIVTSNAVASMDELLYNYRVNESSITYSENFVKRGNLIYEFAFMVGQEVEDFYNELKMIDSSLATKLYTHLKERYNNFTFDLIRTPIAHKREFYRMLSGNREFVKSKRKYLNWKARILTNSVIGFVIACVCEGAYRLIKRFKK